MFPDILYPTWLLKLMFRNHLITVNGLPTTFESLLRTTSLKDSNWQYTLCNMDNDALLIIRYHSEHSRNTKPHEHPYLLIKLDHVYDIRFRNWPTSSVIKDVSTATIAQEEREDLIVKDKTGGAALDCLRKRIDNKQISRTRFNDVDGGFAQLVHDENICAQMFSFEGKPIELSSSMIRQELF